MFLWRAKELLEGGGELLKAEAELASMRLQRMLVGSAICVLLASIAMVGLVAVLSGLTILLAEFAGWGISLLIVGGCVLLLSALAAYMVFRANKHARDELKAHSSHHDNLPPQAEAAQAKERMAEAIDDREEGKPENPLSGFDELKDEAIDFAIRNPLAVGSAALLAVSAIGPGRSMRMVSRGIATAGLVSTILDALKPDSESEDRSQSLTTAPRGETRPVNGTPVHRGMG